MASRPLGSRNLGTLLRDPWLELNARLTSTVAARGFDDLRPALSVVFQPLRDVPLWIEGPAGPIRRLADRLRMLTALVQSAHGWSHPVQLTDEVLIMAFQDRSQAGLGLADGATGAIHYVLNLVRPVVFPFLQDCAEVAHLRLTDRIDMSVRQSEQRLADLSLRWDQIVPANGEDLLSA